MAARTLAAALLGALLAAPVAVAQDRGFLSDYPRLKRDGEGGVAFWMRDGDGRRYDKLLIETIRVEPSKDAVTGSPIAPDDLLMLSDYFNDAVRREANEAGWTIVSEPVDGALRLRMLVADAQPNHPEVGLIVLAAPFGTLAEAALTGVATGTPGKAPYMGGVAVEAQLVDASSGSVVAELQDQRAGNRLAIDGGIEGLATSYATGLSMWGYVKQSFDYWAKWIRGRAEGLRPPKPAKLAS